jgi:beta-galactosidase
MDTWRASNHRSVSLSDAWRFHLGDAPGAEAPAFDDAAWPSVDVPHDWSIVGPRRHEAITGLSGGFAPSGIGWYRRTIAVPNTWQGQTVWIVFEGVYMNAEVWLNGRSLGEQHYGYSTFTFDLTPHLEPGASNVLAVKVDNSAQPNSRWYSGSGIYRPVHLEAADPVRIQPHGVVITTTHAAAKVATIHVRTTLTNETARKREVTLESRVLALPHAAAVLALQSSMVTLEARESADVIQELTIASPALWSLDAPALYQLVSRVVSSDEVDVVETKFGLRTVRVSPERGFELNGQSIKLNGANVHHDHGPLGAASYPSVERRRVQLLKSAGFNAVRTAHNPPAPAFLDACDELGLLVMAEAFDVWEQGKLPDDYSVYFKAWWQRDLEAMILRDRHHPSVVMWSIGNEVREIGLPEGVALAKALAQRVRELDPTRLVTCGSNIPWNNQAPWTGMDPMFAPLDVAGYNYEHKRADEDHTRVPGRVILATESYQADTFACWAVAHDRPYFIGDFVWTGIDYLGESGIARVYAPGEVVRPVWEGDHWPWYGAYCGDIDITGWRKPISHYRNIVWDRGEKLYMAVQEPPPTAGAWQPTRWAMPPTLDSWTWPGSEGKPLLVEIYSRHDSVRLYLNDQLIGEQPTTRAQEFKAVFEVPYEPGTLRAVGITNGGAAETHTLETAGPAVGVRLRQDSAANDPQDTDPVFAFAEIVDSLGRVVPTSHAQIDFRVSEEAKVIAVATGDLTSPEAFDVTSRRAWHGRALVVVQSDGGPHVDGTIEITATVPELNDASDTLAVG